VVEEEVDRREPFVTVCHGLSKRWTVNYALLLRKLAICDETLARLSGKKQAVQGHVKDSNSRKDNTKLFTNFYNNPSDLMPRGLFFILLTNFFTINENMYHWSLRVFRAGFG